MPITFLTGSPPGIDEPSVLALSEEETYSEDAFTSKCELLCPWDQRHALLSHILDSLLEWPYGPPDNLKYARTGSIVPYQGKTGADGVGNTYQLAKITVDFKREFGEPLEGGDETRTFYYETLEPNAEMLKINPKDVDGNQKFFWSESMLDTDKVTVEEAPTKLVAGLDYVVKFTRLASVPAAILTITSHVNHESVVSPSLGLTFPAETLMANAPVLSRTITSGVESALWDLEMRYSYRKEGWNKFWRPQTESFVRMYQTNLFGDDPEIYYNFPLADFSDLLP